MRFVLYRLRHTIFLLFGVSLLSFILLSLAPGDYLSEMQLNPQISPETMAALRHQYDLDRPVPIRYAHLLGAAVQGDLGFSFAYNIPVTRLLGSRILNTLLLTIPATLLAWLIALAVGVFSAANQGKWPDHLTSAGTTVLLITPDILI